VICITGSGRRGGDWRGSRRSGPMLRPVISLFVVIWRHCSGSWARDRPDSSTDRHTMCGPLREQHPRSPRCRAARQIGCQSRETRACFVRRCICVACGLGPDSENKVRALCCRIANRSFSERPECERVRLFTRVRVVRSHTPTLCRCSGVGNLFVRVTNSTTC
jgi:hypothetical protein